MDKTNKIKKILRTERTYESEDALTDIVLFCYKEFDKKTKVKVRTTITFEEIE